MELLAQKFSNGEMSIQEIPIPTLNPGTILVQNHFSLVSPGTEGTTVKTARKSLLAKAKERPADVRRVLETFQRQGLTQTYRAVMKKLDAYSPLGYSCAGTAIAVGEGVDGFAVGDRVACAGVGYANHAEIVAVPQNLCVKLRPDADLRAAAFNTLGAIALQAVRQADLRLGESCAVVGIGLLGRLVCELLRASGVKAFGVDASEAAVASARNAGSCEAAWRRGDPALVSELTARTDGIGVDAVIIAAGTSSLDPINFAGEIVRKKGRVVVLGAVPTGFDRDPFYYRKEIELRMSCSYGPGRYDQGYEELGESYPATYVRWTENRNMRAFQELVSNNRLNLAALTTHEFAFEDAPKAYEMILKHSEPFLGVLLRYDVAKTPSFAPIPVGDGDGGAAGRAQAATEGGSSGSETATRPLKPLNFERRTIPTTSIGVAFVGAGSYAQGNLLPNLPKRPEIERVAVLTSSGATAKRVAEKFRFSYCVSRIDDVVQNSNVDAVFIATRHDSRAKYVLEALKNGKNVFAEKPLCLTLDELAEIRRQFGADLTSPDENAPILTVGFNRRFAPLAVALKKSLSDAPTSAVYRVNAGAIPPDSWIQNVKIGGGRILGEVCHFVDFLSWLNSSLPIGVFATAAPDPNGANDVVSVSLRFENGSIGTIHYFANGSKGLPKERVEVFQAGTSFVLDDFRRLDRFGADDRRTTKKKVQNKGQREMLTAFFDALREKNGSPTPIRDVFRTTLACFAIGESLKSRREIDLFDI